MYGSEEDEARMDLLARVTELEERMKRLETWAQGETSLLEEAVGQIVLVARAVRDLRRGIGRRL